MQRNPVLSSFLWKVAMFLPVCLGLWYWKAEWFATPPALATGWFVHYLFPGWVESVEWGNRTLTVLTRLKMDSVAGAQPGQYAVMVPELNPLAYTYGLPLFAALVLASGESKRLLKLAIGLVALIPFQVWSITFDLLKQVAVTAGPGIAAQVTFTRTETEGVVLAYQLGALILPTLAPVGIWLALNRQFIPILMLEGAIQREQKSAAPDESHPAA